MDTNTTTEPWKRWLKNAWIGLPLVLLGLNQLSIRSQLNQRTQPSSLKTLQVERLEVVNEQGRNVVVLGAVDGVGAVVVGDGHDHPRVILEGDAGTGLVKVVNDRQDVVVQLGADSEGNGGVAVHTGKGSANLGASTTGTPALSLATAAGATLFLGSRNDNDQEPMIVLRQGQEMRVRIEALEQQGMVRVWGPGGQGGNVLMPRY